MERKEALIRILVTWATYYFKTGDEESLYCWPDWEQSYILSEFISTWFGTSSPSHEQLLQFYQIYGDWMLDISENLIPMQVGEITVEEIILDRVIKETWL